MSNWISKATGTFKGDESSPQGFDLFCDCGQKHTGVRRQKWQRIICRACGGSLFVLQRDPYPPPKEKPVAQTRRSLPEEEIPVAAPIDDDESFEEPTPAAPTTRGNKSRERSNSLPPRAPAPLMTAAPPSRAKKEGSGGFWKPFRVILLVVFLLGGITGGVLFRSSQRATAERNLTSAIDKIRDALLHGEWVEARNQLEIAVKSLDRLGRHDADSLRYRQQLRETTALTSLLSQPLSDLLQEADTANIGGESQLATFQFQVKGQWLVVEGIAEPFPNPKKRSRVQFGIPIPLVAGKENLPVDVVVESAELARLMAKSESKPVVLAVQIESIQPSEDGQSWQIMTAPEATVLWAYPETYQGIGYPPEDTAAVAATLTQQALSLGVANEPAPK